MQFRLSTALRPIFMNGNTRILLDTGAMISVFTGNEDDILNYFPTARKYKLDAIVSGFNKSAKVYPAYVVDKYNLGNIIIHNLIFTVIPNCTNCCDFILAGTVLNSAEFTINHKCRILDINVNNNKILCGLNHYTDIKNTYVDGTYSLFQNEIKQGDAFQSSFNKMKGL